MITYSTIAHVLLDDVILAEGSIPHFQNTSYHWDMKRLFSGSLSVSKSSEASFLIRHCPKMWILHTAWILYQLSCIVSFYCSEHKNLFSREDRCRIPNSAYAPAPLSSPRASQLFHSWLADGERWEQTGCCSGFLWQSSRIALSSS